MILVADSGSTKCDWVPVDQGKILPKTSTPGFNPYFCDETFVEKEILVNPELRAMRDQVTHIYFYGAGCSSEERNQIVHRGLSRVFRQAVIVVDHDVYASAVATCGDSPGIACILGTGSNSCYFDGKQVFPNNYGLGYIMGDEGSGSWLGKKLVTHYLYGILPASLRTRFEAKYVMNKEIMIANVYSKPGGNVWLASFAKFLSEAGDEEWVRRTVRQGFEEFFDLYVCGYPDYRQLDVHFVGSIAFHFQDILREVAESRQARMGRIVRHPVNGLAEYFSGKHFPA